MATHTSSSTSITKQPETKSNGYVTLETTILPVSTLDLAFRHTVSSSFLHPWTLSLSNSRSAQNLQTAANHLQTTPTPVAFPTETVYGLAADATSSTSVRSIFAAKQRPADNPLIVHVATLDQLRSLIDPSYISDANGNSSQTSSPSPFLTSEPIPKIYHPLIHKFWPGPLTILLPLPSPSPLAPEVSAAQTTFGARMPSSPLALALIRATDRPLAAPSANASTRPSPTTAEHVYHDLQGRIELILDGGPCNVGVESTVVDGLSDPPVVLRPGGVGMEELRACEGWENVGKAWEDKEGSGGEGPRAPGMKYRHYAPRAKVVLVEYGAAKAGWEELMKERVAEGAKRVGVVRAREWGEAHGSDSEVKRPMKNRGGENVMEKSVNGHGNGVTVVKEAQKEGYTVLDIFIGPSNADVARGLFSALRELDQRGADVMLVEGIDDSEGETAAAVMNRLRKAAGERI